MSAISDSRLMRRLPLACLVAVLLQPALGDEPDSAQPMVIVRRVAPETDDFTDPQTSGPTRADYGRIQMFVPNLTHLVPIREVGRQASYIKAKVQANFVGTTDALLQVAPIAIDRGRFLTAHDMQTRRPAVVLGHAVADSLFPYEDPLDREVFNTEARQYFKVVGVLKKSKEPVFGMDLNEAILMPISTMNAKLGDLVVHRGEKGFHASRYELSQIVAVLKEPGEVEKSAELIRGMLKEHHKEQDYVVLPTRPTKTRDQEEGN